MIKLLQVVLVLVIELFLLCDIDPLVKVNGISREGNKSTDVLKEAKEEEETVTFRIKDYEKMTSHLTCDIYFCSTVKRICLKQLVTQFKCII